MFKNLKKSVLDQKETIKFLSDFNLYGNYEELLEALEDVDKIVLDNFDYTHRDLNKRFVDLSVEVGVEKVYYLQRFAEDSLVSEEQSQIESYIKDYPGLNANFIHLPLSMERLYEKIVKHEAIPQKRFTVMADKDLDTILKDIILKDRDAQEDIDIRGLFFDDNHHYYRSFESDEVFPMNSYKSDLYDFDLMTWSEFVQEKKRA